VGNEIFYTVSDWSGRSSIYKNGKKVSRVSVANPANFLVTKSGDVYYFSQAGTRYFIHKNNRRYLVGRGQGEFLFEDEKGGV
jgi:hypothetical protein